jgi:hypothetical protein
MLLASPGWMLETAKYDVTDQQIKMADAPGQNGQFFARIARLAGNSREQKPVKGLLLTLHVGAGLGSRRYN